MSLESPSSRGVSPGVAVVEAEPSGRWERSVAGVLLLGLALRLAWAGMIPVVPTSDGVAYDALAKNLAAGQGYVFEPGKPSAFWPVGTSAIYAGLYRIFGEGYGPIVGLNLLAGLAAIWLTMLLTRDWFGDRAGIAAGLLMAAWPGQVEFTTILASELLYNALVLLALFAEGRPGWRPWARALVTGLSLTAATYLRPAAMLLPGLIAWCRLVGPGERDRRFRVVLAEAVGVVALMAVLIAPWAYRNYQAFGRLVLISANGGVTLWMGNHPGSTGAYRDIPDWASAYDDAERDEVLGRVAKQYIRENPGVFLAAAAKRLVLTHDRENIGIVWNQPAIEKTLGAGMLLPLKLVSSAYWAGAMLLGLGGAVLALRRFGLIRWLGLTPVVFWGYSAAVHAAILGGDRYHYPSVPFIAALAGLALATLAGRRRGR